MRISEIQILRRNLSEAIHRYERTQIVLPSCVADLNDFLRILEEPDLLKTIGEDPDTPCWKHVLDGGFDEFPESFGLGIPGRQRGSASTLSPFVLIGCTLEGLLRAIKSES